MPVGAWPGSENENAELDGAAAPLTPADLGLLFALAGLLRLAVVGLVDLCLEAFLRRLGPGEGLPVEDERWVLPAPLGLGRLACER